LLETGRRARKRGEEATHTMAAQQKEVKTVSVVVRLLDSVRFLFSPLPRHQRCDESGRKR
jgi:hypothetical protein